MAVTSSATIGYYYAGMTYTFNVEINGQAYPAQVLLPFGDGDGTITDPTTWDSAVQALAAAIVTAGFSVNGDLNKTYGGVGDENHTFEPSITP
jgi:hypothetical protein